LSGLYGGCNFSRYVMSLTTQGRLIELETNFFLQRLVPKYIRFTV